MGDGGRPVEAGGCRVLEFDMPGLSVGTAEDPSGPTGCTVFAFANPAAAAIDKRGGAVGLMGEHSFLDAICLAGGSLYGLEAAAGVASALFEDRGRSVMFDDIATVSGGVIYDFGARESRAYPDARLGAAAWRSAVPGRFPLGRRGAGVAASAGKWPAFAGSEPSGQGGAFLRLGQTRIAVFTVVNALGVVIDRGGRVICGRQDHGRSRMLAEVAGRIERPHRQVTGSTTLTVVVTSHRMERSELAQLGRQVHTSMARAIQPFHTRQDGDVLWCVSTGATEEATLDLTALGVLASDVAWDAVLSIWS